MPSDKPQPETQLDSDLTIGEVQALLLRGLVESDPESGLYIVTYTHAADSHTSVCSSIEAARSAVVFIADEYLYEYNDTENPNRELEAAIQDKDVDYILEHWSEHTNGDERIELTGPCRLLTDEDFDVGQPVSNDDVRKAV